jgi:phosphate transport system substrate-binding protein
MKTFLTVLFFAMVTVLQAQSPEILAQAEQKTTAVDAPVRRVGQKIVIITGARFSYQLVQRWIDDYNKTYPEVQLVIESRGTSDPTKYDVLAEVYEHDAAVKETREYVNVGRYAILPVAMARSKFAEHYSKKGLTKEVIQQVYFHNLFADKDKQEEIKTPFTVYTRLQKAGVPIVFSKYFGFDQKDINGKAIAGSDEHLLKALLRDSTGISYLPLPLIYDQSSRVPVSGLTVIPVDLDGNGKVNDDERFYGTADEVITKLEALPVKEIRNIPVEYLHLSVDKKNASPEAIAFVKWVNENGQNYLHEFGYLAPEASRFDKEKFNEFASRSRN